MKRLVLCCLIGLVCGITTLAVGRTLYSGRHYGTVVPAFYVSPTGSDSNAGTLLAPFATLSKAASSMRASGTILTTYIRAGTYVLPHVVPGGQFPVGATVAGLFLTAADNGETWSFYPPDGYNSAVLDGGSSGICQTSAAIDYGIWIESGSNITINGLKFMHFTFAGVNLHGGSSFYGNWETITGGVAANNNLIENNVFDTIYNGNPTTTGICTNAQSWPPPLANDNAFGGGVTALGKVSNLTVTHNVIMNTYGPGMDVQVFASTDTTVNLTVSNNYFYNTMIQEHDNGCIHDYAGAFPSATTGTTITNNYFHDCGASASSPPYGSSRAIYIDDSTSGVTVTGNVVTGHMEVCFNYHAGSNINYTGNICDMGDGAIGRQWIAEYQDSSACNTAGCMANNFLQNNIIIANAAIAMGGYEITLAGANALTSRNNVEHTYNAALSSDGLGGSASSADPLLSGWTYNLSPSSPAYNAPISFPTQPSNWGSAGFWGPPGFIVPQIGTVPSNAH